MTQLIEDKKISQSWHYVDLFILLARNIINIAY